MMEFRRYLLLILLNIVSSFFCSSQNEMGVQNDKYVKLFLCGDVMLGRGIDQALKHQVDPVLYESYVKDARAYIQLAENENGEFALPLSYKYIWGDALKVWKEFDPDLKFINLETSITNNKEPWPGKGIHYRMHPKNVKALTVAGIDHCSLANNHVMDWGRVGLEETTKTLNTVNIKFSGVGENKQAAKKPSIFQTEKGRVLVFSYGVRSSGIPSSWAAEIKRAGVNFLPKVGEEELKKIKKNIKSYEKSGDIVIFSIHWGGNWGYTVNQRQKEFAHDLIDQAGVDLIYGHSSHHPMGIEVYKDKLIIYGAGDFINDYEGISGQEEYRGELSLMYFPEVNFSTGKLRSLKLVPMKIKKFQLHRANERDALWMERVLEHEGSKLGTHVRREKDKSLTLEW